MLDLLHDASNDAILDHFLTWVLDRGIEPYPAQEEAFLELFSGNHVLLKTPTGSGKSLVALALHFRALCQGAQTVYTAPIKALVGEKFLDLARTFGPEHVGMMTGDGAVNPDAPLICCTAEILAQIALRHGDETRFTAVVMDEFHFYGDADRGMAWQIPLLTMPHAQFLLMSATLGDTTAIEADLEERTGRTVSVVSSDDRPVPLEFLYSTETIETRLHELATEGLAPVYAVHFSQRAATERAQALMSTNFCTKEEKDAIKQALKGARFDSPFGATIRRYLRHGIGLHHAGLLPKYRLLVEQLAQKGLFKVICGTDTLGVGINVPIRTVFFTQLCKFDGTAVDVLTVRDFQQIAGRAGRRGFDSQGTVVASAPDWVIENIKLEAKINAGKKKVQKKGPPTRGYKHWDEEIYQQRIERPPEALEPSFVVDHGLVLTMLQKATETLGDAMGELHDLIETSHLTKRQKEEAHVEADAKLEALVEAGVVIDAGEDAVPRYLVDDELQHDFSMHHELSLFLLHAVSLLDRDHPDYALDVLTMVEAILEHPKVVLYAQVNRAKGERVAELKADGVPYEERMEALEEVTWPKPRAEWIYACFEEFKAHRPWLAEEPVRPKCIAREMAEVEMSFAQFVKDLNLERSEGVLLRYLSQVYKTLLQGVPEEMRTERLDDVLGYLRALLGRVDDSLVATWRALGDTEDPGELEERPIDISDDARTFRARIRAELHAVVRALSQEDYEEAEASVRQSGEHPFTANNFQAALAPYLETHDRVIFDGRVKRGWTTQIEDTETPHVWRVRQILIEELGETEEEEPEEAWSIEGLVDLREDTNPSGPVVEVLEIVA